MGRVHKESTESTPASKKKKSDHSPKASSKMKSSNKPRSDELKDLDEKWGERFARLEAMLLSKTFAVPVNPLQWLPVISPFLVLQCQPMTVAGTGSSLVQTTGEAAVGIEAASKSATHPVEGPGTDVSQQNATRPVEAPGAGTATQPVKAPGVDPKILPSGTIW